MPKRSTNTTVAAGWGSANSMATPTACPTTIVAVTVPMPTRAASTVSTTRPVTDSAPSPPAATAASPAGAPASSR